MAPDSCRCRLPLGCNLSAAVMQTNTMIPWGFCCRPESRQGRLPTSQLGVPRAIPGLPWEQAQLAAMQAEPATDLSLYMQSDRQSDVQPEEAAGMHTYSQSGMQTRQPAGSNNCPDMQSEQAAVSTGISLPSSLGQQGDGQHVHTAEDCNSSTMSLVEAAALAASSPGAVVRVPTSTTLSQADQIALRYQHQVSKAAMHSQSAVNLATAVLVTLHAPGA